MAGRSERTRRWGRMRRAVQGAVFTFGVAGTFWSACTGETEALLRALGEGCLINSDCDDGLVCVFRRCHSPCESSADCPAGLRCVLGESGQNVCQLSKACTLHSDCPAQQVCGIDLTCRDECLTDRDCVGGQVCTERLCADPEELDEGLLPGVEGQKGEGTTCAVNSECIAPLECLDGQCRLECATNIDCPDGVVCLNAKCQIPDAPPPDCIPGQQRPCTTADETSGVQQCGSTEQWGACFVPGGGGMGGNGAGGAGGGSGVGGTGGGGGSGPAVGIDIDTTNPNSPVSYTFPPGVVTTPQITFAIPKINGGMAFPTNTSLVGNTLTVIDPAPLPLGVDLTIDVTGMVDGMPHSFTNTYAIDEGTWDASGSISAGNTSARRSALADSGLGMAVYEEGGDVKAAPFGFNQAMELEAAVRVSVMGEISELPEVVRFDDGSALLVYRYNNMGAHSIKAASFPGGVWGTPVLISAAGNTNLIFEVSLAACPNGKAMAVWSQSDGARGRIWGSIYDQGMWSAAATLDPGLTGDSDTPDVACDGNDSFVLAFRNSQANVFARRWVSGAWDTSLTVVSLALNQPLYVNVNARPESGVTMISFIEYNGGATSGFSMFGGGGTWFNVDNHGALPSIPQAFHGAIHESGDAAVVGWGSSGVYGAKFVAGGSWSGLAGLAGLNTAGEAVIGFEPSGDLAVLSYTTPDMRLTHFAANETALVNGTTSTIASIAGMEDFFAPDMQIDRFGRSLAVWGWFDGMDATNVKVARLR